MSQPHATHRRDLMKRRDTRARAPPARHASGPTRSLPARSNGVAFTVNTLVAATVSVSGSVSGTDVNGQPFTIPIGPVSQTLGTGTPGIAESARTT